MDIRALKEYISDHPEGVLIRMVDGTVYPVPHRDYVWFTPAADAPANRGTRLATSFYVSVEGVGKLVNALLVADVGPLTKIGHGKRRKKSA